MDTGHESNSSIESYFQHLLPPFVCSFMKVIAPSRFTFSIYYPHWVSRCNSLIGHESNSSIEISFQHLLPPSFYCLICSCSFCCRIVISFSNLFVSIFHMRYFSPCSSSLVNTLCWRLGWGFGVHFYPCNQPPSYSADIVVVNSFLCNPSSIDIQVVCTNCVCGCSCSSILS